MLNIFTSRVNIKSLNIIQVICLDNFFTGSKENINHLIGKPNFELIRHDVVEKILIEVD